MRITKKYTGSSCLGKRVYHAQKASSKNDEMGRATENLNILEGEFRTRLLQMSKRKRNNVGRGLMKYQNALPSSTDDSAYTSQWQQQSSSMYSYPGNGFTLPNQMDPTVSTPSHGCEQFNSHANAIAGTNALSALKAPTLRSVTISEHDSEAANSLLGFFNHLERQSSQQDLRQASTEGEERNDATCIPSSQNEVFAIAF